jgi:hypothetical protein
LPDLSFGTPGSTPEASTAFQPQRCGLISITVIGHRHEWIRDKTSRLTPDVQVPEKQSTFIGVHNETLSIIPVRVCNPDRLPVGIDR